MQSAPDRVSRNPDDTRLPLECMKHHRYSHDVHINLYDALSSPNLAIITVDQPRLTLFNAGGQHVTNLSEYTTQRVASALNDNVESISAANFVAAYAWSELYKPSK